MVVKINIDPIIEKTRQSINMHKLPEKGFYKRYIYASPEASAANEYGVADAANLLYTINDMPTDPQEQGAIVAALRSFQHSDTGLFCEPTHHPYHCTAHCTAALELFDAQPLYDIKELEKYESISSISGFLSSLGWEKCDSAHLGAGIFSAMLLTKRMSLEWQNAFFDYLDDNIDTKYGVSLSGAVDTKNVPRWRYMGDWFHFLFCYHACHRAFPCARQNVDFCIDLYKENDFPESFGRGQRFLDIDWAFSIYRSSVQEGYRTDEVKELLRAFAKKMTDYLFESPISKEEPQWNDMHLMFGSICAIAELQTALPGELLSTRPLRQVLDRRPFI